MKEIIGTSNRILEVDLTNKTFNVYNVSAKELKMYLGGKGLGLKLLYDRMAPGTDPLGKNNIIAFMTGVLMGTGAICSGRFAAVTKSPLTGIMAHSTCGGPFGSALKTSGWDGLLVKGVAKYPVYLVVNSEGVEFKDAKKIWKKKTSEVQTILEEEGEGILTIGPAGENLVRYANICSGSRFLGRAGMGAVMGSKKLKAIVARGKEYRIIPKKQRKFKKARETGLKRINNYHVTAIELRKFGTPGLVNHSNRAGILPVRNFTEGVSDNAYKITGEEIAVKHSTRHHTCKPCSILCGHKGNFGGKELPEPEYETLGLLGSNLDIFDPVKIAEWNYLCGDLGMDTMSTGGVLAWVMEAAEKKLVKSPLKFGSPAGITKTIQDIAACKGLGKDMAMGTRALSKKYGGEDFAIHVKGLEMAAYDPRGSLGLGLGYAVANRGACHLSSTLMALEVFTGYLLPYTIKPKHHWVKAQEDLYCVLNSIQICIFTTYGFVFESPMIKYSAWFNVKWIMEYLPKIATKMTDISIYKNFWTSITGIRISRKDFLKAGERIHVLERYMNTLEGISRKDDTLPGRMLDEGRKCDPKGRTVPLEAMLDNYYMIRGYDNNGIPTDELLKSLEIEKKSPPKTSIEPEG